MKQGRGLLPKLLCPALVMPTVPSPNGILYRAAASGKVVSNDEPKKRAREDRRLASRRRRRLIL